MKNKVLLLVITIAAVSAMAVGLAGCSCGKSDSKKETTTIDVKSVPTDKAVKSDDGEVYVEDNFPTISPTEKTTDKDGNTVVTYTDSEGNKVKRTVTKDGVIKIVIKDKNGKVIKKHSYKEKKVTNPATKKISDKKYKKANSKKTDDKKTDKNAKQDEVGAVNDDDGWSDFY